MSTYKDYDLNIWQQNTASIFSVQGESTARTVNFHLKEEAKVENARGEMETQLKPFDATGYSARLYIEKPDGTKVFFDGTVTDAINGEISFTLPYQATVISGEVSCTVYLTKSDGTTLKAIGITLDIQSNDLEGAAESTSDFSALVVALNKADTAAAVATQAVKDVQQAVTDVNAAIVSTNAATAGANTATVAANSGAAAANQAATNAGHLYQMVNPLTGQLAYVTDIIDGLTAYIFRDAITAQQMDGLNKTAQDFDALAITAADFDARAKTILGVA
jgi:hypothetical protein